MSDKPTKAQVEEALRTGQALPAGDYAVDFRGGIKVRDLTKAEADALKASRAATKAAQEQAAK